MSVFQTIKLSLKNIRNNKLRSVLTMIGIVIGISSVIIMVALGSGSSKNITQQVQSLGTNLITVSIFNSSSNKIDMDKLGEIKQLAGVKDAAPVISTNASVKSDGQADNYTITGTTSNFMDIRGLKLSYGRFVSDLDVENKNKIVILGSTAASDLYGFMNPLGQYVKINGDSYKVVGVLESQGGNSNSSTDDMILSPISTVMSLAKTKSIQTIYIEASGESTVDLAQNGVDQYLTRLFKSNGSRTHNIMSQKQLLDTMGSITKTLSILLGGIAGISLIVGGIGVMNVMLVSVSERTREIGIRKALGGTRKDIMFQFLIEALVLSSIGGIIGIGVGIGGGYLAEAFGMNVAFSPLVVIIALSFSMIVGIIFGIFPAYKASMLKPIDALRFE